MTRIFRVKNLLSCLNPSFLEIVDESQKHKGHAGVSGLEEETHLKIIISADFGDMKLLDKHRKVKELINLEFEKGLHAVSISFQSS